jgi:pimeloyl-ACP methyl ester carboxylesterase
VSPPFDALAVLALAAVFVNAGLYVLRGDALRRLPAYQPPARLGLLDAGAAFLKESLALAALVLLVPLGCCMRRRLDGSGKRGPVLLVPGWCLNRGSLCWLRWRLRRDGWSPVVCLAEYNGSADFEAAAARLDAEVDSLALPAERPATIIGHGLGGLVAREYARRTASGPVRRLVTLGTPHTGTQLARHLPLLRDKLAPTAPPMRRLRSADRVPERYDVVAIHSMFDAVVLPPSAATYPRAFNIQINGVGHNALLFSSKVYDLLAENLQAPLAEQARGGAADAS